MSTSGFQPLEQALRDRLAVIADTELRDRDPAAHLNRLRTASEEITRLQRSLPVAQHPRLEHFLEQCSYQKALEFLRELPE